MPLSRPSLAALAVLVAACLPGGPPPVVPSGPPLSLEAAPPAPLAAPRGPLRVAFAAPRGETTRQAEISVVFDRPMRALGLGPADPPPPVTLQPAAKGAFHWIGSAGLRFDAEAPLPSATAYRLEIPAGTRALDGTALAAPFVLEFVTPRPALIASDPVAGATEVTPDATVTLSFNEAVADAEILRVVSIRADKQRRPLPFTIDRLMPERVSLHLAHPLPVNDRVHVRVDASLHAEGGELPAGADREVVFATVTPPTVRRLACAPHPDDATLCNPDASELTVELTSPVSARALASAVVLDPPIPWDHADYQSDDPIDTLTLRPEIKPGAHLRLRIDPARGGPKLVDAWGQRLAGASSLEARFGNRPADVSFGLHGTYWSARARHDFPVRVTNTPGVTVSAAPYPLDQVLADLAGAKTVRPSGDKPLAIPDGRLDETVSHGVTLDDLLPGGTRGPVRLLATRKPETVLQLTDLALSARVAHGAAAVLVSGLDDGKPVPGAAIEVYRLPARGKPGAATLAGGATTGADGGAAVPLRVAFAGPDRIAVVARTAGDWIYATMDAPRPTPAVGVVYTERGIYRPGETVKLAGVFRVPGPAGLETPGGAPVTIEVTERSSTPVVSTTATLSEFGTFAVDVPIRGDAPTGFYHARVRARDGEASTRFRVAEYRPTAIAVEATTDRESYVRGDTLTCRASGRYLHGGAMRGTRASLMVNRGQTWFMPPGLEGFTVGDPGVGAPPMTGVAHFTGALDARGATSFSAPLALPGMGGPERVACDAEVMDLDRQALTAEAAVVVHPGEVYVALAVPSPSWITPGAALSMRALAITPAGERRAAVVRLEATLREEKGKKETALGACDVTTGPEPVGCSVNVPRAARPEDEITVRGSTVDRRGNPVHAAYVVRVVAPPRPPKPSPPSPPPPPPQPPQPHLRVSLVERKLALGQTGHLDLASPFTSPSVAFVTIEREGLLWQQVVPVAGASARIDFPITHAMMPDAYIAVTLISGASVESGEAWLEVESAPQKLAVAIDTHGPEHTPGEALDVDVTVTDAAGAPARAEVTLYAADEGSLSLAGYRLPDPHRELFEQRWMRGTGVETRDDRVYVGFGGFHRIRSPSIRMGATMSNPGGLRSDFRQTVVFATHLVTDAAGRVRRRVKLPDGLTAYRFMAVAVAADDRTGAGEATLRTSLPLMARASLPRVIRVGDRFEAAVVVTAADLPAGDVALDAEASGLTLAGPARQSLRAEPGVPVEARFPVQADRPGPARLTLHARLGEASDAMTLASEVVTPIVPESAAVDGETRSTVAERLAATAGLRPDYGGLEVTLSSGPLAGLADGIRQLVEYPYGCTEQTVSRMVPLLALRDLARALEADLPADTDAALARATATVLGNQRGDGGFGLWPESGRSQPWITAWALWGLGEARRRGLAVPERAEARGRGYLGSALGVGADGAPDDLALAAFLVDLAAEDGHPDTALSARLVDARDRLPPFGQALLLHALALARQAPDAQRDLARLLEAFVRIDGATARAVVIEPRLALFDSDTRTTAMILRAFVAHAPDHPLVPKLALGLLSFRRNGRFHDTHDAAWALLALDALRRARPPAAAGLDALVFLGPLRLGEAHLDGPAAAKGFTVPMADLLARGGEPLTLAVSGAGTLHYQARLRFARAGMPEGPEDSGIFIQRTVRPLGPSPRAAGTFVAGELVQVVLDVVTPSPRSFVSVESPLPGGFEVADTELRGGAWLRALESSRGARRELRDDRVVYFLDDLPAGITTLRYVARASTPGTFVTPPSRAEEMYAPETFGRTAAETTVVVMP